MMMAIAEPWWWGLLNFPSMPKSAAQRRPCRGPQAITLVRLEFSYQNLAPFTSTFGRMEMSKNVFYMVSLLGILAGYFIWFVPAFVCVICTNSSKQQNVNF